MADVAFSIGLHTDEAKAGRDAIVTWNAQIAGSYDKVLKAAQAAGAGLNIGGVANTNIAGIAGLEKSVNALGASIDKLAKSQAAFIKSAQEGVQASSARTTASKAAAQAAETEAQALDRITQRLRDAKAARDAQAQATTQQKAAQDALNASVAAGAGGQVSNAGLLATAKAAEQATVSVQKLTKARQDDEAAANALVKSADTLVGRYAPMIKAQQQLAADRAALTKLQKEGTLTAAEEAAVIAGLEGKQRNLDAMQKTLGGSTKAQAAHFQSLKYQINDVVSGLIMGQPPMMIFVQQGGQIVQALDGMDMSLSKVKASTWALAGVTVATVAVLATVGSRIASISSEAKQLNTITSVLNPNLGATAEQLRAISFAVAEQGTSRSTGMAALTAVIKDARIQSTALAEEIAKVSVDVAAVLGGEVPDWAKKIADAAATGSQGFDKLLGTLPGITAETLKAMRAAEQHGDRLGAAKIAVDALEKQYGGSAKQMQGDWENALHEMSNAFDTFLERVSKSDFAKTVARGFGIMGRTLTEALREPTLGESIVDLNKQLVQATGELDRLRGFQSGGVGMIGNPVAEQEGKVKELEGRLNALIEKARNEAKAAEAAQSGGGAGGQNGGSSIGGQIAGLTENDRNKLNLAADATARQAAASKLLSGALGVQARAAAENRIALADMVMQYPALGAATAQEILTSKDFGATLKTLPPELQKVYEQMGNNSANKLAGDMAQAGVALSSAAYAAKVNAEAAGQGEAAMRAAAIEAEVYAHRMDGTASAVRASLVEQEKFVRAGIHQAFAAGIEQEVAANDRLVAGMAKGVTAWRDAETYNAAYLQTIKEIKPTEEGFGDALARNIDLLNQKAKSSDSKAFADYEERLRSQTRQLELQQKLVGATPAQAARLQVESDINEMLRAQKLTYEGLSDAEKAVIDRSRERAIQNADLEQQIKRQEDAYNTIANSLEKAFERVGDALVNAFVEGKGSAVDFGNIAKGILSSLLTDLVKMSVIRPFSNAVLGTNYGTLFDLGSIGGGGGSAANQNGGGLTGALTNTAMSKAGGWAMDKMGLTGGFNSLMNTPLWTGSSGIAPGFVDTIGATQITNTPAMTGGGATLGGALGAAGAGALGGGLVGGYLGTATNSKVVGGLSGAAAGAGAAYLASAMELGSLGGPWGIAIGAVVGAIMGMLGTQKATVGKTASADVTVNAGGKSARYGNVQVDNEGDPEAGKALGTALSGIFSIAAMGGGKLTKDFGIGSTAKNGLYVGGSVPYKEFGDDIAGLLRYTLLEQGGLKDGGVNTIAALKNTKGKDWEEVTKDVALGASIDAGLTALKEFDKTLGGITRSAKETTSESLKPMLEEFERAKKLKIGDAYKDLASDRLKSYLDVLKSPVEWTETEQAVASATGQFQAMREAFIQLDPAIVSTIDAIEKETKARIARDLNKSLDQQINEAGGKGGFNTINGYIDTFKENVRSLAAVGEPATKAQDLFNTSLTSFLKTLSGSQLDDITARFGGDIGRLAQAIKGASDATKEFASSISSRLAAALGDTRGSSLIALDAQQAKELKDAKDAGLDTSQLAMLQGVERNKTAFDLAQRDVLDWYDREIEAKNEYITNLQSGAVKIAEAAKKFKSAFDDIALNDNSPLSPIDKLNEARAQFDAAYGIAKSGTATETEKQDAQQKLISLGPQLIQIAKSYYASSDSSDYQHVRDVYKEFGDLQALGVDKADTQLKTAQDQLKELQKARTDASRIGERNLGKLDDLKDIMSKSYQLWQTSLSALPGAVSSTKTNTPTLVDTPIADRRQKLEALTNADIERLFGGFSDIQSARSANPAFNLAEWFKTFGINEVLNGQRVIAGFANGGVVGNGIYGADSVVASYAGGGNIALAGGEGVLTAAATSAIGGAGAVDYINRNRALPANDRWGGSNVVPYQPRSSGGGRDAAADEVRQLRQEVTRLHQTIDRMAAMLGDQGADQIEQLSGIRGNTGTTNRKFVA